MANFPRLLTLLAAGSLGALSIPSSAAPGLTAVATSKVRDARADKNVAKLDEMIARYEAMPAGAERDRLALEIDAFANQRYAHVSRLYWYTDLATAQAAAAASQRPILHLRMLGRLDEELSCANSRFFRTTLYPNAEVSKFLRDNFVLVWSSERPVPRVTIDFGDGRKIERTTTGNSAHYVMDARGNVLDVLPGLYAPVVFKSELAKSAALARSVRALDGDRLVAAVKEHHARELALADKQFAAVSGTAYIVRRGRLLRADELGPSAVERAQRATYAKSFVEIVGLQKIGIDAGSIDTADVTAWSTVGQKVWNLGLAPSKPDPAPARLRRAAEALPEAPALLDARSIALVRQLRSANPLAKTATDAAWMIARLEQHILADTALNQFQLRQQIRLEFASRSGLDFAALNDRIYAAIFHTPKTDPWLGLLTGTDFTALPADGVLMP